MMASAARSLVEQTTHWWPHQIGKTAEQAFYSVARSPVLMNDLFGHLFPERTHVVQPLEGMNEVYVACKGHKNGNSDTARPDQDRSQAPPHSDRRSQLGGGSDAVRWRVARRAYRSFT